MSRSPTAFALLPAVVVLACLLAAPVVGADEAAEGLPRTLEQAGRLVAEGRAAEAVDLLEQVLGTLDDDAEAEADVRAALGRAYLAAGEAYSSLQHFEAALGVREDADDALAYADALIAVAREHMGSGGASSVQVLPYLLDALDAAARASGDEVAHLRRAVMGEARYWMGEMEEAVALLEDVDPKALDALRAHRTGDLLAHALYSLARFEEAAAAFEAVGNVRGAATAWSAARRGAETAEAYAQLLRAGRVDARLLEEAFDAARYAGGEADLAAVLATLDVDEAVRPAWLTTRGRLAAALGEHDAAAQLLREAAALDPAAARALYELGQVLLARPGDDAEAKADAATEAWLEALQRAPADERVGAALWDLAGRDYATAWRSPRALRRSIRIQQGIVEAHPDDGLAWANLGNTLRVAGRLEDAKAAYDRAQKLEPSDPVIASDRGLVLSALGRKDQALEAFAASAELDPDHDAAWQNAARLHWRAGRDEAAAAALAEGLRCLRSAGRGAGRYRFLLERTWRTRHREDLR